MSNERKSDSRSAIIVALIGAFALIIGALGAPYVTEWSRSRFASETAREAELVSYQDPLGAFSLDYPAWCSGFRRSQHAGYGYEFGDISTDESGIEQLVDYLLKPGGLLDLLDSSQTCGIVVEFDRLIGDPPTDEEWNSRIDKWMKEVESGLAEFNAEELIVTTQPITSQGNPSERSWFLEVRLDPIGPLTAYRMLLLVQQRGQVVMTASALAVEDRNLGKVNDMRKAIESITWDADKVIKAIELQEQGSK